MPTTMRNMKRPPIRVLDVAGSPEQMGATHGGAHAVEIRRYTDERVSLVMDGLWSGGPMQRGDVLDLAASMLLAHEAHSPSLYAEMCAMADAAGITEGPHTLRKWSSAQEKYTSIR